MQRRRFLTFLLQSFTAVGVASVAPFAIAAEKLLGKLQKPASYWRQGLSDAQFDVLFHEDTERPWSSALNKEKRDGTFLCAACNQPLFDAKTKYDSGTGWPSFWNALADAVGTSTDYKLLYPRTEYHCARCGGHQGHIFKDGPKPTGLRYCNNGIALQFVPEGTALPELKS